MGEEFPIDPAELNDAPDRARRLLDESDSGDQYRNPQAELLADRRNTLGLLIKQIDRNKLGKKMAPFI